MLLWYKLIFVASLQVIPTSVLLDRGPPATEEQPIPSNPTMKAFLAIFLLVVATAAFASAVDENSAPAPADDFDSAPAGEVTRGPAVAAVPVK